MRRTATLTHCREVARKEGSDSGPIAAELQVKSSQVKSSQVKSICALSFAKDVHGYPVLNPEGLEILLSVSP